MKHLLNNLTEQEKNSIREQHTGGMNVVTENFSRLINTKSGDVKPLVSEQMTQKTYDDLLDILIKKYGDSGLCGVSQFKKVLPYDEDVKKFQIAMNKMEGKKLVDEDGLLGKETKARICYLGN
jgi:hypothetical protein